MLKLVVLVSGGGTNLQAIMDAVASGQIPDTCITRVISNNPGAYALERAAGAGIPTGVVTRKAYPVPEQFNKQLLEEIRKGAPDLIVLAGCLVVIPPQIVEEYPNRIINIHPALIPSFCGQGYYGLKVHEKVLERGVRVTGATVHFVDGGTDTGPILLQKAIDVLPEDTPESLQKRIMENCEWKILPQAIRLIADGKVVIENNICHIR